MKAAMFKMATGLMIALLANKCFITLQNTSTLSDESPKVYPMSWTILISFDPNRGICAIIGIALAEDAAKQGEIQFDQVWES